jgi:hypothetical protein
VIALFISDLAKMQRQEVLWDRDVLLSAVRNVLTQVIKLPVKSVVYDVSDNVICHWQLQIFLNAPSGRRNIMPLL